MESNPLNTLDWWEWDCKFDRSPEVQAIWISVDIAPSWRMKLNDAIIEIPKEIFDETHFFPCWNAIPCCDRNMFPLEWTQFWWPISVIRCNDVKFFLSIVENKNAIVPIARIRSELPMCSESAIFRDMKHWLPLFGFYCYCGNSFNCNCESFPNISKYILSSFLHFLYYFNTNLVYDTLYRLFYPKVFSIHPILYAL
jgi:hypothetical protein